MKLKKMTLVNFQSFKDFTFEPEGQNCSVYGANGTGKTTLYNAMCWLFYDKPSTEEKSWSPKTYDSNGNEIPKLEHSVYAEFVLEDGQMISFEKVLTEKWVTKRGSKENKYEGNVASYKINGVPHSMTEFNKKVQECLYEPDLMQIASKPSYFSQEYHWENRREMLLNICGNIKHEDIINSNPELKKINSFLTNGSCTYTVDELLKIAKDTIRRTKDELDMIPTRLDEATRARPDVDCTADASTIMEIDKLKAEIESAQKEKASFSSSDAEIEIKREIANLRIERDLAESEFKKGYTEANQKTNDAIFENRNQLSIVESQIRDLEYKLHADERELENLKEKRKGYTEQYTEIKAREWKGDTICQTCGQPLPSEKILEAQEKFNIQKASLLEQIAKDCECCSKQIIADKEATISDKKDAIEKLKSEAERINKAIDTLSTQLIKVPFFSESEEGKSFDARLSELQEKLLNAKNNIVETTTINALQKSIDEKNAKVIELQGLLSKITVAKQQQNRIDEIAENEKKLQEVLERYEQAEYLCEQYYKTKSSLLDNQINHFFTNVRFKLFEEQINGGLKETCEVMIPCPSGLVPYGKANTASQINAGLEIIDVITKHYGKTMPIFIDNAESVIDIRHVDAQIIKLIVMEGCDELKVVATS